MTPGLLIRLVPLGPWRAGPASGAGNQVDVLYHSDSLYSAVTHAMLQLGKMEVWLKATSLAAEEEPAVRFSSCFPWQGETTYVVPPRGIWPPPGLSKLPAAAVRFVPVSVVSSLLGGSSFDEGSWIVDGDSRCLIPRSGETQAAGPFRIALRAHAAVDRVDGVTHMAQRTSCLEFAPDAGLWLAVAFADEGAREEWAGLVEAAFRLLADTGFGGKRSIGWGRTAQPVIATGTLPDLILKVPDPDDAGRDGENDSVQSAENPPSETAFWLLSLFRPGARDEVDWERGDYVLSTRSGRVESAAGWGDRKKSLRMVEEGSVLFAKAQPAGSAADVAPDGFPHPVFRYGAALSIEIPVKVNV